MFPKCRKETQCFLLLILTLMFASTWCHERMCTGAAKTAFSFPEEEVEKAFLQAEARIRYRRERNIISDNERMMMKSKGPEIGHHGGRPSFMERQAHKRNLVLQEASDILAQKYKLIPEEVYSRLAVLDQKQDLNAGGKEDITCDTSAKFRTPDGSCNNPKHPEWGMANTCFSRLLEALYRGNDDPWQTEKCGERPPSRGISERLFSAPNCSKDMNINNLFISFSQLIAHDMTLTPGTAKLDDNCCESPPEGRDPQCFTIGISANDSFYSKYNQTCMEYSKTKKCPINSQGRKSSVNSVTHFIDGSAVYGNNEDKTRSLRTNDGSGKLKIRDTPHGELLPNCTDPSDASPYCSVCYDTGDARSNQHCGLAGMHTLLMREHNRIAKNLKDLNPHWDDEKTFQETRRILIALIQVTMYNEFLEIVVGSEMMNLFDLFVTAERTECNVEIDPSLSEEFAAAGFRVFHYMIYGLSFEDSSGTSHRLRDMFFCCKNLQDGAMEDLMRSMMKKPALRFDCCVSPDVRNFLFKQPNEPTGRDLLAVDIKRGRDVGLPPYIHYVRLFLHIEIRTFGDFVTSELMTKESALYLECVYRVVEAVDLFVALCFEIPRKGALVGPVAVYIIALQFDVTKRGDCYWVQDRNSHNSGSFSDDQLESILNYSLAALMCHTTNLTEVPQRALEIPSSTRNPKMPCKAAGDLNLGPWKEEPEAE